MDNEDYDRKWRVRTGHITPCIKCGGYKEPGRGRKYCIACSGGVDLLGQSQEVISRAHQMRRYGTTITEYEAKLAQQNGGCAICGAKPKTRRLCVDHNHETGVVRGILCPRCNASLEFWESHHEAIQDYLETYS